jgi:hypothetical protein
LTANTARITVIGRFALIIRHSLLISPWTIVVYGKPLIFALDSNLMLPPRRSRHQLLLQVLGDFVLALLALLLLDSLFMRL